ncbi:MAG: NPCBM/NEW2 domain-containing protein [Planctomycetota bacterium]
MIIAVVAGGLLNMIQAIRARDTRAGTHRRIVLCIAIALLSSAHGRVEGASTSSDWHEKDASIRFRIEKDYTHSLIPQVSLLDIQPDKKSESVWKWIEKHRWSQKPRVNGRLCLNFIPSFSSKPIIYNLHRDLTHFVARGSIIDGADPNTSVRFQVHADKRPIFRSRPVTVAGPVAEMNVAIPPRTKQLKLVTESSDKKYFSRARWVDPGFMLRRRYPKVSFARIHAPGYNLEDFIPEVFVTSDGSRVGSQMLSALRGEPMDILFDSSKGNPSYLVYLVPKNKYKKPASSWQPQAGLVLETKQTKKGFRSSDRLPEFSKAFGNIVEPVGRSLVDDVQHVFPIHRMPKHNTTGPSTQGGYGLYRYRGFFAVDKGGKYSFATVSNWDSYLTVDDKSVVAWPGRHGIGGGTRGQKQGTVSLQSGIHKLEYFNYNRWGQMYCLAAWKRPGEKLRPMTRTDFVPFGRYRPTSASLADSNKVYIPFEWLAVDDFRLEQAGRSFVKMRFEAVSPPGGKYAYRWVFDDGTAATGQTVDHVFLRPALRKVQLEVSLEGKLAARFDHDVYVRGLWDKTLRDLGNLESFDKVIKERDLDNVPADDVVNLFVLAGKADRPDWKQLATATLSKSVERLVSESDDTNFMFGFGQHLHSYELKEYDKALELFNLLRQKPGIGKSVQRRAAIRQAELLVTYFGKNEDALKVLGRIGMEASSRDGPARRAVRTRAEALLAIGQSEEGLGLLQQLSESSGSSDKVKQQIKHSGLVRHARLLAETEGDQAQLDHAMANIETVLSEDPVKVFSPAINLVRLDIYLARKEFRAAFHLTERLKNLQLGDYDIAQVLARQVIASCGMKEIEKAKAVYAQLNRDYPYSPATDQARQAVIRAISKR